MINKVYTYNRTVFRDDYISLNKYTAFDEKDSCKIEHNFLNDLQSFNVERYYEECRLDENNNIIVYDKVINKWLKVSGTPIGINYTIYNDDINKCKILFTCECFVDNIDDFTITKVGNKFKISSTNNKNEIIESGLLFDDYSPSMNKMNLCVLYNDKWSYVKFNYSDSTFHFKNIENEIGNVVELYIGQIENGTDFSITKRKCKIFKNHIETIHEDGLPFYYMNSCDEYKDGLPFYYMNSFDEYKDGIYRYGDNYFYVDKDKSVVLNKIKDELNSMADDLTNEIESYEITISEKKMYNDEIKDSLKKLKLEYE